MEFTVIECAFRLQRALDSNHPFSPCIDNTAKKLIALIINNNKAPDNTKEETPVPSHDAITFQGLLQDLDSLVNALYNGAAKAASYGVDVQAIRALLQEQINKYRDETRSVDERVAKQEERVRVICEDLGTNNEHQIEVVRTLIKESESSTRESILGLGVRVNAFEGMGLKGLRKDMDEKVGSWQTALEQQNRTHATELNALRGKYENQIKDLKSAHDNKIKEFGLEITKNTVAIGDRICVGDEKSKKQQEELEVRIMALESNWRVQADEANATVEILSKKVKELEARCEVLATNASYDDFEKLRSPVEKVEPAKPLDASDAASILEHLKQLELNQNASITTHLELSLTSTQMQLDSIRADVDRLNESFGVQGSAVQIKKANGESSNDTQVQLDDIRAEMENLDERLVVQETEVTYELSEDMVRDQHIQAVLNKEINRWVEDKVLIGETGCIDVAQREAEKAIKYAIRSGRVMSRLVPPSMASPYGSPEIVNGVPTNGLHLGYTFAASSALEAINNSATCGPPGPTLIELAPNHSHSPKPAPTSSAVTKGTPAAPIVHLPPHLTLGGPAINPTAPAFTPSAPAFLPMSS